MAPDTVPIQHLVGRGTAYLMICKTEEEGWYCHHYTTDYPLHPDCFKNSRAVYKAVRGDELTCLKEQAQRNEENGAISLAERVLHGLSAEEEKALRVYYQRRLNDDTR